MNQSYCLTILASASLILSQSAASADWSFNGSPNPNAFIQTGNMTLEFQCDRIRFAPAGYDDAQNIMDKQALSIRFMKDGATEAGAFQAGAANATIRIVDNYPVEIIFSDAADYDFVLDQVAQNAVLNLSMVDQDVSYGIFELKGSGASIKSLRTACRSSTAGTPAPVETPEGIVYCGGGQVKRQIEYVILDNAADDWNARVTVNGETIRAMNA